MRIIIEEIASQKHFMIFSPSLGFLYYLKKGYFSWAAIFLQSSYSGVILTISPSKTVYLSPYPRE